MKACEITYGYFSNLPISFGMGNVRRRIELAEMAIVSDKKISHTANGNDIDYYPFGSPMDGHSFSSDKYQFGFNGKKNDDKVKGDGNSLDFGARINDSWLGRWLSMDPLQAKYPNLSAYNFCANNPIIFIDPSGMEIKEGSQAE